MTVAYWCVLIAGLLPYLAVGFAKWGRGYNNHQPRQWAEHLDGVKQRAYAAHLNSFEAFPLFAAGIIVAHLQHARQSTLDMLAVGFIVARLVYILCYVTDKPGIRSLVWALGVGLTISLFFIG